MLQLRLIRVNTIRWSSPNSAMCISLPKVFAHLKHKCHILHIEQVYHSSERCVLQVLQASYLLDVATDMMKGIRVAYHKS